MRVKGVEVAKVPPGLEVTLMEIVALPDTVGVPEITPVEVFRINPVGSMPEARV